MKKRDTQKSIKARCHATLTTPGLKKVAQKAEQKIVLGIDPGLTGAFVVLDGAKALVWNMPTKKLGKGSEIVFAEVHAILHSIIATYKNGVHIFLERAVSFGMGSTGAFNYGRGFAAIEIAIATLHLPVTYVEPGKWTKEMHAGLSKDWKPKAKSIIAIERLFPAIGHTLPRNTKGKLLEGPVDALLIAGYGLRQLGVAQVEVVATPVKEIVKKVKRVQIPDFY